MKLRGRVRLPVSKAAQLRHPTLAALTENLFPPLLDIEGMERENRVAKVGQGEDDGRRRRLEGRRRRSHRSCSRRSAPSKLVTRGESGRRADASPASCENRAV